MRILVDYKNFITILVVFIPVSTFTMMGPTYSIYLEENLNITPSISGYIMGAGSIMFAICCVINGRII